MKSFLYFLGLLFFAVLFFISCRTGNYSFDLDSTYKITKNECLDYGLPITCFELQYPSRMQVIFAKTGAYNPNYIEFYHKTEDVFYEGLTIATYEGASSATDYLNETILEQYLSNYNSQIPEIEVFFKGKSDFCGKDCYQLQLAVEISDLMYGIKGNYKILLVLLPHENGLTNGVTLIFQATDKSDIEEFSDFGHEGNTAKIWQSFSFK